MSEFTNDISTFQRQENKFYLSKANVFTFAYRRKYFGKTHERN